LDFSRAGLTTSADFLDVLAPVTGDGAARASERSDMALARSATDAMSGCMAESGFDEYGDLGLAKQRIF
jgi:hypothetical protein